MVNGGLINNINNKTMKKIILSFVLLIGLAVSASAKDYVAPARQSVEFTDSVTNDTYTIKNEKYDVFKSKSGAFDIWKTSKKTGKKYKYYLPKDIQVQMGRVYKEDKN